MSAPELLQRTVQGDPQAADELLPLVYDELKVLARRSLREESPAHTLQPTALLHEAYLRLIRPGAREFQDRHHFLALAARVIRHVLIDHARGRDRKKRGGDRQRVTLDLGIPVERLPEVDVLALEEALQKLTALSPRQAEVVELRYFGGLSMPEVAQHVDRPLRTVEADWRLARTYLYRQLKEGEAP